MTGSRAKNEKKHNTQKQIQSDRRHVFFSFAVQVFPAEESRFEQERRDGPEKAGIKTDHPKEFMEDLFKGTVDITETLAAVRAIFARIHMTTIQALSRFI